MSVDKTPSSCAGRKVSHSTINRPQRHMPAGNGAPEWDRRPSGANPFLRRPVPATASNTLALPYGSIEILCFRVPNEQLLSLLKGSLQPLLTELTALKSRESVMLAEDDPNTSCRKW